MAIVLAASCLVPNCVGPEFAGRARLVAKVLHRMRLLHPSIWLQYHAFLKVVCNLCVFYRQNTPLDAGVGRFVYVGKWQRRSVAVQFANPRSAAYAVFGLMSCYLGPQLWVASCNLCRMPGRCDLFGKCLVETKSASGFILVGWCPNLHSAA